MWAVVPLAVGLVLAVAAGRLPWPVRAHSSFYATVVPAAPLSAAVLWATWGVTSDGNPAPLPYLPLFNPLEVVQASSLVGALVWSRRAARASAAFQPLQEAGRAVTAIVAFVAANAVVARIVHFYLGVPFDWDSLPDSAAFQSGVSMLWGVTALSLMTLAASKANRQAWLVGAALLALLVGKLFVVDLRDVDGLYRIVSFLVTGLLILAIGYFSPVPPKEPAS